MSLVFERYQCGGGEFVTALALADHAHDDGTRIYPGVAALASKTRQSERTVQYHLRAMEACGWLQLVRDANREQRRTREYRINPDWIAGKNARTSVAETPDRGANIAPLVEPNSPQPSVDKDCRGANIAPLETSEMCAILHPRGAKLLHPNHQLTIKSGRSVACAHAREDEPQVGALTKLLLGAGIPSHRVLRDRQTISAWLTRGVSPTVLSAAIDEARLSKGNEPLSVGYLEPIVQRRMLESDGDISHAKPRESIDAAARSAWNSDVCVAVANGERPASGWKDPRTEPALIEIGGFGSLRIMLIRDKPIREREFVAAFKRQQSTAARSIDTTSRGNNHVSHRS